jgi:hypothetical protein
MLEQMANVLQVDASAHVRADAGDQLLKPRGRHRLLRVLGSVVKKVPGAEKAAVLV